MATYPDEQVHYLRCLIAKRRASWPDAILSGMGPSQMTHTALLQCARAVVEPARSWISPACGGFIERHHARGYPVAMDPWHSSRYRLIVLPVPRRDRLVVGPEPSPMTGLVCPLDALRPAHQSGGTEEKASSLDEASIEFTTVASPVRLVVGSPHAPYSALPLFHALAGLRIGYALGHP